MPRLLTHLRRRQRPLLLGLCAGVMFGLWFGAWVRVLGIRPRAVIRIPEDTSLCGITTDGATVITGQLASVEPTLKWKQHDFWNASTGERQATFERGKLYVLNGVGGRLLVESGKNPQLYAFLENLTPNSRRYLTSDKDTVAIVTRDGSNLLLSVWDISADRERFSKHNLVHGWAHITPDGRFIACVPRTDQGNSVAFIDLHTGEVRQELQDSQGVSGLIQISRDGKLLAAAVGTNVQVWDLLPGKSVKVIANARRHPTFSFSSDGKSLVTFHDAEAGEPLVQRWDTSTWDSVALVEPSNRPGDSASGYFIPNSNLLLIGRYRRLKPGTFGNWFATYLGERLGGGERQSVHMLMDYWSGETYGPLPDGGTAHTPDGKTLAVQSSNQEIRIYDLPPRRPVELYLLFSALPALLFTGLLWWRVRP